MKLVCCICGMEINDINKNVNSAAFSKCNQGEAINFCPFCGAAKEHLLESNNYIINAKNGDLEKVSLKILDHAVKLELFNADFYNKVAALAKDINIRNMFKHLSRIERIHANIHMRLGSFTELPKLTEIRYDKYKSDLELLEQAKLREKHAVEYYRKYMNSIDDNNIKQVLEVLMSVEEEHIVLLSN